MDSKDHIIICTTPMGSINSMIEERYRLQQFFGKDYFIDLEKIVSEFEFERKKKLLKKSKRLLRVGVKK